MTEKLVICGLCNWKYPPDLLNPLVTNKGPSKPVCGICALQISNKVTGITRTEFDGNLAEEIRQDAIIWRDNHPEMMPKGH